MWEPGFALECVSPELAIPSTVLLAGLHSLVVHMGCKKMIVCVHAKSLQSYPILCNPMDCSPPDSSAHGMLQPECWSGLP